MVDIAKFFLEFTVDESCGKCAPCRIGTKRLLQILEKITSGNGEMSDLDLLEELAEYIKANSLCGLGQTAPNPVLSTLRYFRDEYIAHIRDKKCPAGVCKALHSYSIDPQKCVGCGVCAKKLPGRRCLGSIQSSPHHRYQDVHQVRRLYGEVHVRGNLKKVGGRYRNGRKNSRPENKRHGREGARRALRLWRPPALST